MSGFGFDVLYFLSFCNKWNLFSVIYVTGLGNLSVTNGSQKPVASAGQGDDLADLFSAPQQQPMPLTLVIYIFELQLLKLSKGYAGCWNHINRDNCKTELCYEICVGNTAIHRVVFRLCDTLTSSVSYDALQPLYQLVVS